MKRLTGRAPDGTAYLYNMGGTNAATTGDWAHAATTGCRAHAATTGNDAHAAVKGRDAIAAAMGIGSRVKGALGCWLVCAEWVQDSDSGRIG